MLGDLCWKFGTFGQQLQNALFEVANGTNGAQVAMDLFATNINRGRDHGLQPYVYYIKKCFNLTITNFTDFNTYRLMNGPNMQTLQMLYS